MNIGELGVFVVLGFLVGEGGGGGRFVCLYQRPTKVQRPSLKFSFTISSSHVKHSKEKYINDKLRRLYGETQSSGNSRFKFNLTFTEPLHVCVFTQFVMYSDHKLIGQIDLSGFYANLYTSKELCHIFIQF